MADPGSWLDSETKKPHHANTILKQAFTFLYT